MKKGRINIVLVVAVVIICFCSDALLMVNYHYREQNLQGMKNPMDIANEYMRPGHEEDWRKLDGVFYAGKDSRKGTYEVGRVTENIGRSYFTLYLIERCSLVNCSTKIEGTNVEISSSYPLGFLNVGAYVTVYNEDKGYWEGRDFIFKCEDGEYIPYECIGVEDISNKAGLEEITGMTIEEILEIAEKQQEECENMLYEMKEAELKGNKIVFFLGLLLVNGTGIWLIIWKGLKRQKKDGHITETKTVPEDGEKI